MYQGYLIYLCILFFTCSHLENVKVFSFTKQFKFNPNTRISNYFPKYGFRKKASLTVKVD